jgi:iron(III) transport system substrate-binding protein
MTHTFTRLALALVTTWSATAALAQQQTVNALCSTDHALVRAGGQGVRARHRHQGAAGTQGTGEALAQLRAEAANPKTDIWWGGTGDPFLQAAEPACWRPYRPAYLNDLHGWAVRQYAMSGNMVGGFYTSAIGFGYNEDVLKKRKLPAPKCWSDLI